MTTPIDDREWDLIDLVTHTNDGKTITGQAVLCDLDGRHERVRFVHARDQATAQIFPEAFNTLSAIEWVHTHGMADLLTDLKEELDVVRDRNRERDTMGRLIAFTFKGQS